MANSEHLKILRKGVEEWNQWREDNLFVVPRLKWADLRGVNLCRANLCGADLRRVDLSGANLEGTNFNSANLNNANLNRAWLRVADLHRADFNDADLSGAKLSGANLSSARLRNANLGGADLRWTNLHIADLSGANLRGARLREAHLDKANLCRADLSGADLAGATISDTGVERAVFFDSQMSSTVFANMDLNQAQGLDMVRHLGPSTIGFDTVQRSKGSIPEVFLRGVGMSDEFIVIVRAMDGAIQFYSCFISYSGKDQLFADRLYADLQAKGVRCWFARHDMQGGKKTHEQIDIAIQSQERLLLILSPESIHSEWVKTEIIKASKRELVEKRRMLFPVRLKISYEDLKEWECFDGDTGKDLAREIREYYIPDFSQWESPEKFKEEFVKLVRDLKKAEQARK